MNESSKKIILYAVVGVLVFCLGCSFAGNAVQCGRIASLRKDVSRLESELGQYRERNGELEARQREFVSAVGEARRITEGAGETLDRLGGSVAELRKGLAELQKYVEDMEDCLDNIGCDTGDINADTRHGVDNLSPE